MEKSLTWLKKLLNTILTWSKNRPLLVLVAIFIIFAVGGLAAQSLSRDDVKNKEEAGEEQATEVKTVILDLEQGTDALISAVGTVAAEASIDIVALNSGTVRNLYFQVGDKVKMNQALARLQNNQASTGFANSRTSLANAQMSYEQTRRVADETVRQAELGVSNAEERVRSAEITLAAAQNNLANISNLREKGQTDIKNSAIIAFSGHLNTAKTALDQINYILDVDEEGFQLDGIKDTLGAKDPITVTAAENNYRSARSAYSRLAVIKPNLDTINQVMPEMVELLALTRDATGATLIVLDNTITNLIFPESSLTAQKTSLSTLKTGLVSALAAAEQTQQALANTGLINKQEEDALKSAVEAASNQLGLARLGLDNAAAAKRQAEEARSAQLLAAQAVIDGTRGQLNIVGTQVADLNVKSPIAGQITAKYVEIGTEVMPGQKIAQVAQNDRVKIEVGLPSEDIYRIALGQSVTLDNGAVGVISSIDPTADPITRKVKIEIAFDNKEGNLIVGTFYNVAIPTKKIVKSQPDSFFIPLRAVTVSQTANYVFLAAAGKAKRLEVVLGRTEGALVEIIDGLHDGDELIVEGNKNLNDGSAIMVAN